MTYLGKTDLIFGYLAALAIEKQNARRYAFCWTVIRYLDEIIDSTESSGEKRNILEKYCTLVDLISNNIIEKTDMADDFEKCLFEYVKLDATSNNETISLFQNILKSFEMDIERTGKILRWADYDHYLKYRSDSVLELYYVMYFNKKSPEVNQLAKDYARTFQYVDDVCDFFDDFKIGQINITQDELDSLQINSPDLKDASSAIKFANRRKELILRHYFDFIKTVNSSTLPFYKKRYLKESIGYNIDPIITNKFNPGYKIKLPFISIITRIASFKNQGLIFEILHKIIYLYCLIPWYRYKHS